MTVTESAEGLQHLLDTVDRDAVILETFVAGREVNYCAVVGDGAERDLTYRTVRRGTRAWSPSVEIECTSDPGLIQVGRRLAEALPCQGLLNVDAIVDADWPVFRPRRQPPGVRRVFASRQAGFDLSGAYLRWLGDQLRPPMAGGSTVGIYPDCVDEAIATNGRWAGLRIMFDQARVYGRPLEGATRFREIGRSAQRPAGPAHLDHPEFPVRLAIKRDSGAATLIERCGALIGDWEVGLASLDGGPGRSRWRHAHSVSGRRSSP